MSLSKDERNLLVFYFRGIGKPDESERFGDSDDNPDLKALGWKKNKRKEDYDKEFVEKLTKADELLQKRGFIEISDEKNWERTVKLTFEGYELGSKYNTKLGASYAWLERYRLILEILGLVIALLIAIFTCISAFSK